MLSTFVFIVSISGGILLSLATLDKLDGDANFFNKIAGFLAPFQTAIGVALLVFGFMYFRSNLILTALRFAGGLLLLTHAFGKVPALETSLRQLSAKLMPFKAIIGIALIFAEVFF